MWVVMCFLQYFKALQLKVSTLAFLINFFALRLDSFPKAKLPKVFIACTST